MYTILLLAPSYTALVPHFLQPLSTLRHTAVVIVIDTTFDLPRRATHLARLDSALGPRRRYARARGVCRIESSFSSLHCISEQAHLHHYTKPSAELLFASSALQGTILSLGQETFTHNIAGIPIFVACIKADLIDDNTDLVGRRVWDWRYD